MTVLTNEVYVILGDFNAHVSSRTKDDEWWYERDPLDYGKLNEAGEELLSLLATNEGTVCSTWFKKKDIHEGMWQHPKLNKWHCIDYVIMKKNCWRRCLDASVRLQ